MGSYVRREGLFLARKDTRTLFKLFEGRDISMCLPYSCGRGRVDFRPPTPTQAKFTPYHSLAGEGSCGIVASFLSTKKRHHGTKQSNITVEP